MSSVPFITITYACLLRDTRLPAYRTMLSATQSNLTTRLTASLGNSTDWQSKTGDRCNLWFTRSFEIIAPKKRRT